MDDPDSPAMVMPSQGVHLVVDQRFFPGTDALMIPKTKDGRVLFALPWHGKVVIGTTDTALNIINEEPIALDEEVAFILMHFNEYATSKISRKDILSVFAGLRPLVKTSNKTSTSLASRDHTIIVSKSNLITITGGKWTTYRKMAKDAVNNAAFVAKLPIVKCATRNLKLHWYTKAIQYGDLLSSYGCDSELIKNLIKETVSTNAVPKTVDQVGIRMLKFCNAWDMKKIADNIQSYAEPFQAKYPHTKSAVGLFEESTNEV
jgi:glycerol-3-phosphate dehydrogenase